MATKAKVKAKPKAKGRLKAAPKAPGEFAIVSRKLTAILSRYKRGSLRNRPDAMGGFCLVGPATETSRGREVWFGAVGPRKNYVSFHLMPVYAFPDLLKSISPALKKRMQGKSCFSFKEVDEELFDELAKLTEQGYKRFKAEKLIR